MSVHTVQLGECAEVINGYAFKSNLFTTERQGLPVIRIRDVIRGHSETYYTGDYPNSAVIQNGDLLIGMDGEFNIARWQGGRALLNQRVCKLAALSDKSDISYLRYALPVILKRIEDRTPFVTVKHLSSEELKDELIPLPQLSEQKRIAGLLEQADRLRRTRRYALELSDSFLPAAFLELFGDLRSNPQGYEVCELGEICDVRDGTHDSPKYHAQGVPLVTSKNLANGFVDLSEAELISEDDYEKINKRSKVDRGDILMPMIGTIGNPVLVEQEPWFAIKNVALIKFIAGSPSPIYIRELLRGVYFDYLISMNSRGGTQQFIALGDIRGFGIPVPPLPLQQKFAALVERHEHLRATQREALRQAEHLFQTLLHRAFSAGG